MASGQAGPAAQGARGAKGRLPSLRGAGHLVPEQSARDLTYPDPNMSIPYPKTFHAKRGQALYFSA